ncbi:MAG: glycosyltransferase [Clostridiales bacterium]|jgi:glycosyltransferase involved in cell wall biosynthesis|nr:glycosyltransferase [Clostridiales bacterium]
MSASPEFPLISVIVPVYNVERYIRRALKCLAEQDYSPIEFILVDDGSPDGCPDICDEYAAKDSRFRVIHQRNKGPSAARNAGLDVSRGRYITFADSDDWTEPDMYSSLYEALAEIDAEISICGHFEENPGGRGKTRVLPVGFMAISRESALEYLVKHATFEGYTWNKLISADLINRSGENGTPLRFHSDVHICEDVLFFCRCFINTDAVIYLPRPLYHYVIHEGSLLRSYNAKRKTELLAWDRIIELADTQAGSAAIISRQRYADSSINLMLNAVRFGNKDEVMEQKAFVRRYIAEFLSSPIIKPRQKIRGLIIFFFPYSSNRVWQFLKRFHVRWPY